MTTDTTTKAVVPHGAYDIEGMEGLGPQDIILPRYTIVQPTSQGKGDQMGWFHNNLTQEITKNLEAVILKISRSRTLWSGDMADKKPECASYDGITSRDGTKLCADCEFNKWADDPVMKVCKAGYVYLCCSPADDSPFLLGAMGTSVRPAKMLNSLFAMKKRSPFSAMTTFSTEKVEDPAKGKYFVLKYAVTWLDIAKTTHFRELYQQLANVTIHEVEPEEEASDDKAPF